MCKRGILTGTDKLFPTTENSSRDWPVLRVAFATAMTENEGGLNGSPLRKGEALN